jgi:hypothetical protein
VNDIEKLIRTFEVGITRRGGVRCDVVMCARVATMLEELKERRSNDVYSDKR